MWMSVLIPDNSSNGTVASFVFSHLWYHQREDVNVSSDVMVAAIFKMHLISSSFKYLHRGHVSDLLVLLSLERTVYFNIAGHFFLGSISRILTFINDRECTADRCSVSWGTNFVWKHLKSFVSGKLSISWYLIFTFCSNQMKKKKEKVKALSFWYSIEKDLN